VSTTKTITVDLETGRSLREAMVMRSGAKPVPLEILAAGPGLWLVVSVCPRMQPGKVGAEVCCEVQVLRYVKPVVHKGTADCGAIIGACLDCCCTCGRRMGIRTQGCLCDYDGAPDLRTAQEKLDALVVELPREGA
jgi:hypothetical protein